MRAPAPFVSAATIFFSLLVSCSGQGSGHFGSADPTTEGFILHTWGSPSLAPISSDLGVSAWAIGAVSEDIAYYTQLLSPQALDAAAGWSLSITVRIPPPFHDTSQLGPFTRLGTGTKIYLVFFSAQSNGDPLLLINSVRYTFAGLGSGYHNYNLRFDNATGVADLWVDGTETLNGLPAVADVFLNPSSLRWGQGQHQPGTFNSNWNEVSLRLIPEPSSLALICVGVGMVLTRSLATRLRSSLEDL